MSDFPFSLPHFDDMRARFAPSDKQVAHAVHVHSTHSRVKRVVVPLVFPDKEYGFWAAFAAYPVLESDDHAEADEWYYAAMNAVEARALAELGDRPGTVGYAWVYADGTWSAFESLSPGTF